MSPTSPRYRRQQSRRVAACVLAATVAGGFLLVAPAVAADLDAAEVDFGATVATSGAAVRIGDSSAAPTVCSEADQDGWQIGNGRHHYVYVNLDDALVHDGANAGSIEVDYFDAAPGRFTLTYDAQSSIWKQGPVVELTGSQTWKTTRLFVSDALFTNRENGSDIRIATWSSSMGSSPGPVCIGGFRYGPSPIATDDLQIDVSGAAAVYDSGTEVSFGVLSAHDTDITWTVRDYDGVAITNGTAGIDAVTRRGTVVVGALPDGYYTLTARGHGPTGEEKTREAGFAILPPAPDIQAQAESRFGVNLHQIPAGQSFTWSDSTDVAARAGMGNIRIDTTYWGTIEKTKGVYTFPENSDMIAADLASNGQRGLYILGYQNALYGGTPSTPEGYEAFGAYGAAVAERFHDTIGAIEVWNEYYGGFSNGVCSQSAKCYVAMLKAAHERITAVAPDVTLVGGSSFKVPLDWYEEFIELGGLDYVDAISIHPYRAPGTADGLAVDVAALTDLLRAHDGGRNVPVWITEQGWSSANAAAIGVSEQTQAQAVSRSMLEASAAGVEKYYLYDLINDGTLAENSEHNFGTLRRPSSDATALTPKPSYVAYATTARELIGTDYVGDVSSKDANARGYRFSGSDRTVTALWSSDRTTKPVSISTRTPVTVVDMLGRETVLSPVKGKVQVTLSSEPLFVRADVSSVTPGALVSVQVPEKVTRGADIPVTVHFEPHGDVRSVDVTIEGTTTTVSAHNGSTSDTIISIPAGDVLGSRTVRASAAVAGVVSTTAIAASQVVANSVDVDIAPMIGDGFDTQLALTLANRSWSAAVDVSDLSWAYGAQAGELGAQDPLGPGETRTVSVPLTGQTPFAIQDARATVTLGDGSTVTDSDAFSFAPITRAKPTLKHGKLTGLEGVPAIDLAAVGNTNKVAPDVVDGDVWVTWDKKGLYVSAVVSEPVFRPAKRGEWLPAGDSIAIGLQPGRPGEGLGTWGAKWYMLYAGQALDGTGIYTESLPRTSASGMMSDAEVQVVRDETAKTTTYLIAIPWGSIEPLSPKTPEFSLTVALNKRDDVDRDNYRSLGLLGWQQWGDGVNNWKLIRYQQVRLIE